MQQGTLLNMVQNIPICVQNATKPSTRTAILRMGLHSKRKVLQVHGMDYYMVALCGILSPVVRSVHSADRPSTIPHVPDTQATVHRA